MLSAVGSGLLLTLSPTKKLKMGVMNVDLKEVRTQLDHLLKKNSTLLECSPLKEEEGGKTLEQALFSEYITFSGAKGNSIYLNIQTH